MLASALLKEAAVLLIEEREAASELLREATEDALAVLSAASTARAEFLAARSEATVEASDELRAATELSKEAIAEASAELTERSVDSVAEVIEERTPGRPVLTAAYVESSATI